MAPEDSEPPTDSNVGELDVPADDFVARIDELLNKGSADCTVPWPSTPPPEWAIGYRPRRIVDLGTGSGGFTRSVLCRLAQWGCLGALEEVVLVEGAPDILPGGENALRSHLVKQVAAALELTKIVHPVRITVEIAPIELVDDPHCGSLKDPLLDMCRGADLIVVSHLTYYFGDGSGRSLLRGLATYLARDGRIWCVVRKSSSPLYLERSRVHKALGVRDPKPFDSAEYFESQVLPDLPVLSLLAAEDKAYLADPTFPGRLEAAHLLMWRRSPSAGCDGSYYSAAATVAEQNCALFCERHFILGRSKL